LTLHRGSINKLDNSQITCLATARADVNGNGEATWRLAFDVQRSAAKSGLIVPALLENGRGANTAAARRTPNVERQTLNAER
jgi:hypothetical protein